MTEFGNGVVVGYDGSASADQALRWAAAEAAARGTRLTVCHVWQRVYGGKLASMYDEFERAAAAQVADMGVRRALAAAPGLDVHPLLIQRATAYGLIQAGRSADLLVVGARGVRWYANCFSVRRARTSPPMRPGR